MSNNLWNLYYQSEKSTSPLLQQVVDLDLPNKKAIDLGCGAGLDSNYLSEQGFDVIAIDKNPEVQKYISSPKIKIVITDISKYKFPTKVGLINAQWILPFVGPDQFMCVWEKCYTALDFSGVFVGQLFGIKDEWNTSSNNLVFHTKNQAEELLSRYDILMFDEEMSQGTSLNGPKFWHVFHFIARKNK